MIDTWKTKSVQCLTVAPYVVKSGLNGVISKVKNQNIYVRNVEIMTYNILLFVCGDGDGDSILFGVDTVLKILFQKTYKHFDVNFINFSLKTV